MSYKLTALRQPVNGMALAVSDMLGALIEHGNVQAQPRLFSASIVDGATARLGPEF